MTDVVKDDVSLVVAPGPPAYISSVGSERRQALGVVNNGMKSEILKRKKVVKFSYQPFISIKKNVCKCCS